MCEVRWAQRVLLPVIMITDLVQILAWDFLRE